MKQPKNNWVINLVITVLVLIPLTGCSFFGGDDEPPPAPEETVTPLVVDLPTPTPLPVQPTEGQMVSLVDTGTSSLSDTPLEQAEPQAVQMPRFSTSEYSFVPPAGWEVAEMGDNVLIVRRPGDDLFTGPQSSVPYVYLRTSPAGGTLDTAALLADLDGDILANLAGVDTTEPAQGVVIDGIKGVWQFAQGRNDTGQFRAYLMAIPAGGDTVLYVIVWGAAAEWGALAPQMAKVLETLRFPAG